MDVLLIIVFAVPVVVLLACKAFYGMFARVQDPGFGPDQMYDSAYGNWRRRVMSANGRLESVFAPFPLLAGERCFACGIAVALYLPSCPTASGHEGILFDTACGVSVGRGWSIVECFPSVRFQGRGTLCVTNRNVWFDMAGGRQVIPLDDIHTVAASCSGLLIGAQAFDRPLVFQGINGQQFRDTLHILMGAG